MKILTTVKKVVDVELNMRVKDGALVEDGLQYVTNAWDESAVEESIRLKENNGAQTTLVSVGGGDNAEVIRRCYAMGMEKGIHIEDPALERADSFTFARVIARVFEAGDYDLIITGKQAQDTDNGQTGIFLAEILGLPCVSNVIGVEALDEGRLKISRSGDAGTEELEVTTPAVIAVDVSINEPRLPQMRGVMMAKKKPIETMDLAALGTSAGEVGAGAPRSEVLEFMASETRKAGQKFEGDAAEITARVVDLLVNEAKAL
ncbi:Electron transfer flavoprotein alpha/beta-subunit [Candidatus Desulfarcum epimagneticum]|uniref:Electron transfer flavoprotein subunit beta n=1 Tax=uncultured Desulfobacteraceae bacterium TaxID=218296 RepID=A0A484HJ03_9BACT|nr:Electron transfer flavoprotein alpha/beta-subunit [uncultured Desulfobacteraceae bacterium]